ncbi:hypothetical protein QPK87_23335 [Kamptonema cortianum]|nr:hypothetical protein [Oscillatoria laete-virens]MDK3159486.1 hypothetical protein [Kamptonema cortianum]MDL5044560.1 hypothetical protein [Oscillatoria amoena NRMC-F 0135]MDL5053026.1 hypothetical protein [Oscillatoria laete-virens NRMC-F 0139]
MKSDKLTWTSLAGQLGITRSRLHELRNDPESPGDELNLASWQLYMEGRDSKASSPELERARLELVLERKRGVELDNARKRQDAALARREIVMARDIAPQVKEVFITLLDEARRLMGKDRFIIYRRSCREAFDKIIKQCASDPRETYTDPDDIERIMPRLKKDLEVD